MEEEEKKSGNCSIPEELICPLCGDLLTDAVMLPCCATSACDVCARDSLATESICPLEECGSKDVSADDLIPNRRMRTKSTEFRQKFPEIFERKAKIVSVISSNPPSAPPSPIKPEKKEEDASEEAPQPVTEKKEEPVFDDQPPVPGEETKQELDQMKQHHIVDIPTHYMNEAIEDPLTAFNRLMAVKDREKGITNSYKHYGPPPPSHHGYIADYNHPPPSYQRKPHQYPPCQVCNNGSYHPMRYCPNRHNDSYHRRGRSRSPRSMRRRVRSGSYDRYKEDDEYRRRKRRDSKSRRSSSRDSKTSRSKSKKKRRSSRDSEDDNRKLKKKKAKKEKKKKKKRDRSSDEESKKQQEKSRDKLKKGASQSPEKSKTPPTTQTDDKVQEQTEKTPICKEDDGPPVPSLSKDKFVPVGGTLVEEESANDDETVFQSQSLSKSPLSAMRSGKIEIKLKTTKQGGILSTDVEATNNSNLDTEVVKPEMEDSEVVKPEIEEGAKETESETNIVNEADKKTNSSEEPEPHESKNDKSPAAVEKEAADELKNSGPITLREKLKLLQETSKKDEHKPEGSGGSRKDGEKHQQETEKEKSSREPNKPVTDRPDGKSREPGKNDGKRDHAHNAHNDNRRERGRSSHDDRRRNSHDESSRRERRDGRDRDMRRSGRRGDDHDRDNRYSRHNDNRDKRQDYRDRNREHDRGRGRDREGDSRCDRKRDYNRERDRNRRRDSGDQRSSKRRESQDELANLPSGKDLSDISKKFDGEKFRSSKKGKKSSKKKRKDSDDSSVDSSSSSSSSESSDSEKKRKKRRKKKKRKIKDLLEVLLKDSSLLESSNKKKKKSRRKVTIQADDGGATTGSAAAKKTGDLQINIVNSCSEVENPSNQKQKRSLVKIPPKRSSDKSESKNDELKVKKRREDGECSTSSGSEDVDNAHKKTGQMVA